MTTLPVNEPMDNTFEDPSNRAPLVLGHEDFATVTREILSVNESPRPPRSWYISLAFSSMLLAMLGGLIGYLFFTGVGVWGTNNPVMCGFPIVNFVFWVGIGHAGTLISAILLLFRQQWRTSINRFAEAMTLFAVACAALFPLIHTGRPWLAAYWLFPYPNSMDLWPQFRSPLIWDVFAVSTYFTVSLLFWFTGLVPDLATLRDRAQSKGGKIIYGMLSLGWRGSARHWHRYEMAYLLLAGISTPLVLSVHTIVSFDFAVSVIPGWHATIFPPYFVAGAIYSGFAMVMTLAIPLRKFYGWEDFITMRHIHNMTKIMLVTGMIVAYGYVNEAFFAWYSGSPYEAYMMYNRMTGPYAVFYWSLIGINATMIQLFWFRRVRDNIAVLFVLSLLVNVGMWLERFIIIVTSLHRDFLPSSWDLFEPTRWDFAMFAGTIGLFLSLFFLFVRVLPAIAMFEMRTIVPQAKLQPDHHG